MNFSTFLKMTMAILVTLGTMDNTYAKDTGMVDWEFCSTRKMRDQDNEKWPQTNQDYIAELQERMCGQYKHKVVIPIGRYQMCLGEVVSAVNRSADKCFEAEELDKFFEDVLSSETIVMMDHIKTLSGKSILTAKSKTGKIYKITDNDIFEGEKRVLRNFMSVTYVNMKLMKRMVHQFEVTHTRMVLEETKEMLEAFELIKAYDEIWKEKK